MFYFDVMPCVPSLRVAGRFVCLRLLFAPNKYAKSRMIFPKVLPSLVLMKTAKAYKAILKLRGLAFAPPRLNGEGCRYSEQSQVRIAEVCACQPSSVRQTATGAVRFVIL